MGLSPIDMKGFIPKTQEISEVEGQKNIRDRSQIVAQQTEQEKRFEREINQVRDSDNAEKASIQKEKEEQSKKRKKARADNGDVEVKSEKASLESLNISVKEENLAVGRKIDMKA